MAWQKWFRQARRTVRFSSDGVITFPAKVRDKLAELGWRYVELYYDRDNDRIGFRKSEKTVDAVELRTYRGELRLRPPARFYDACGLDRKHFVPTRFELHFEKLPGDVDEIILFITLAAPFKK
jgi:hypothetical protein